MYIIQLTKFGLVFSVLRDIKHIQETLLTTLNCIQVSIVTKKTSIEQREQTNLAHEISFEHPAMHCQKLIIELRLQKG